MPSRTVTSPTRRDGRRAGKCTVLDTLNTLLMERTSFLVDPWTYNYFHSHWVNQGDDKVSPYPGEHTTLVTQGKALDMLDDAAQSNEQFFMMVAPGE